MANGSRLADEAVATAMGAYLFAGEVQSHEVASDATPFELVMTYDATFRRRSIAFDPSDNDAVACTIDLPNECKCIKVFAPAGFFVPEPFWDETPGLDLQDAIGTRTYDPARPTVGMYGKLGRVKGTFDLIEALGKLRTVGMPCNLLLMSHSIESPELPKALARAGIADSTTILPFMPHWRVPQFLRLCDVACFLERRFPIRFHVSAIPHEILASGTCLVLSGDIAEWLPTSPPLKSSVNWTVVPDPRDTDQLARALSSALSDPAALTRIAAAGRVSAQFARAQLGMRYEEIFRDALQVPGGAETGGNLVERAVELADRLAPRTHAYCPSLLFATVHALVGTRAAANAHRLVALALAQLSEAPALDVVGRETALFERLLLWLLEDDADSRRLNKASNASICGAVDHDAFPVLEPGVKIAEFSVDPRGLDNPARTATPVILVFVRDGNTSGRVFEISPVWREVLGACDGARSVADVVSHASGLGIAADDVHQMLSKLVSDRIITLHSKCVPVGARMARS